MSELREKLESLEITARAAAEAPLARAAGLGDLVNEMLALFESIIEEVEHGKREHRDDHVSPVRGAG